MTDLEEGEMYEIVVVAVNGNDDETESEPKYIRIGPDEGRCFFRLCTYYRFSPCIIRTFFQAK